MWQNCVLFEGWIIFLCLFCLSVHPLTTFCLSIHPLINTRLASVFWLLWVCYCECGCASTCWIPAFSPFVYIPGSEMLEHVVCCLGFFENEMAGWHHWLNGREFAQTPGDGVGQGSLACWVHTVPWPTGAAPRGLPFAAFLQVLVQPRKATMDSGHPVMSVCSIIATRVCLSWN